MSAAYTRHEAIPLGDADRSGKRVVRRRDSHPERASVFVDLLSGRSPRRGVSFEEGTSAPPLTLGSLGAWSVDARDIAPMHGAIAWNGRVLFVAALSDAAVNVEGVDIRGRGWVEVAPGRVIELGGARLHVTRRGPPGEANPPEPLCASSSSITRYAPLTTARDAPMASAPSSTVPLSEPAAPITVRTPPRTQPVDVPMVQPPPLDAQVAPRRLPPRTLLTGVARVAQASARPRSLPPPLPPHAQRRPPAAVPPAVPTPPRVDRARVAWSHLPRAHRLAALVSVPALLLAFMFFAFAITRVVHQQHLAAGAGPTHAPAGAPSSHSGAAPASAPATEPSPTPAATASMPATPAPGASTSEAGAARRAIEAVSRGDIDDAAHRYAELAASEPDNRAYVEAARITAERAAQPAAQM